ncbi:MarR family transcriptional regulator [Puteibacter caeruleilacunae]|nr:MarR family transcriptional regulator [Puteibacter caeruleilacunae]
MEKLNNQRNSSSSLISVASRLLSSHLQQAFAVKNIDITIEQWTLLFYLWEKDGQTQRELSITSNKEKSTITRQINAMEKRGLIERQSHPVDKRNNIIVLTEKGKSIKTEALEAAGNITLNSELGVSDEDLEIFKRVLKTIICNLTK